MQRRQAFTLVELLVSTALVLFIMVLLTQAFVSGLETFRQLKAIGDMEEKLRATTTILRRDLAMDHFEGGRRLSNWDWNQGPPQQGFFRLWQGSPTYMGSTGPFAIAPQINMLEGTDPDGIPSYRSSNHMLHFTVNLHGNSRDSFFAASVPTRVPSTTLALVPPLKYSPLLFQDPVEGDLTTPPIPPQSSDSRYQDNPYPALPPAIFPLSSGGTLPPPSTSNASYSSQWAEVVYFLRQTGTTLQPNNPAATVGVPLFTLHRRQLAVTPSNAKVNYPNSNPTGQAWEAPIWVGDASGLKQYAEMSCKKTNNSETPVAGLYPDTLYFNGPADLTVPVRRFGILPFNTLDGTRAVGLPSFPLPNLPTFNPSNAIRTYPRLGEAATPPGPWSTAPALAPPYFGYPPPWQDNPDMATSPGTILPGLRGADVLLSNVISFDVRIMTPESLQRSQTPLTVGTFSLQSLDPFVDLYDSAAWQTPIWPGTLPGYIPLPVLYPQAPAGAPGSTAGSMNPVFQDTLVPAPALSPPFAYNTQPRVFDTWSSLPHQDPNYDYSTWNDGWTTGTTAGVKTVPLKLRILALQIQIRVWDIKTQTARQITIRQDM